MISPPVNIFRLNTFRFIFFIAGLSNLLRVKINVEIIPIEIIFFFVGVFSLLSPNTRKLQSSDAKILKFLNLFLTLSLVTQLSVDSFYNVNFIETMKSCAQILVMWALLRVALIYIQPDYFRFIFYVSGYLLSLSIQYLFNPTIYMQAEPWKFAVGPTVTGLYFLFIKSRLSKIGNIVFIAALILMDVLLGSRSLAVFTILAFVLTLKKRSINRVTVAEIFLTCIVLIGLIFGIERTYYNLAIKGAFGQSQQIKSLDQYNAGPILFTARSEIAFELAAIKSNPIFGSGSNPNITFQILNDAQSINQFLGVTTDATNAYKAALFDGKIPQHSIVLSAWIEGGIVLASFWMIILFWTLRKFGEILRTTAPLSHFAIFIGLSSIWAMLFSPLGAGSRMELAVGLSAVYLHSKFGEHAKKY